MAERVPFSRRPTGCLAVARTCSPTPPPTPAPSCAPRAPGSPQFLRTRSTSHGLCLSHQPFPNLLKILKPHPPESPF